MSLKCKDKGKLVTGDLKSDPREKALEERMLCLEDPAEEGLRQHTGDWVVAKQRRAVGMESQGGK